MSLFYNILTVIVCGATAWTSLRFLTWYRWYNRKQRAYDRLMDWAGSGEIVMPEWALKIVPEVKSHPTDLLRFLFAFSWIRTYKQQIREQETFIEALTTSLVTDDED